MSWEVKIAIYNGAGEDVSFNDIPVGALIFNTESFEMIKKEPNDHIRRNCGGADWNLIPPDKKLYWKY